MPLHILMLCDFNRRSANTIIDHATSFGRFSGHRYFYANPYGKDKPGWLSIDRFDAVVIHYSVHLLGRHYINETWREAIAESSAFRVLFIQDEYRTVNAFVDRMKQLKIDILYTCYPETEIEKVYPSASLPGVTRLNNLTGYVADYLERKIPDLSQPRPIDVGYRARGMGFFWLGELYQEKYRIGVQFLEHAAGKGLRCDISSHERDRLYGKKWLDFLESCRCFLGTESGASVVDFTGEIEKNVRAYCGSHPAATFEEVRGLFFEKADGAIRMNQVSPRIFESIGCGCCPVLFEGEYSGILKPDRHYIPLKKDFSNINEVIQKIKDPDLVRSTALRAFEEIIGSGSYSYRTFVKSVDKTIEAAVLRRRSFAPSARHSAVLNNTPSKLKWHSVFVSMSCLLRSVASVPCGKLYRMALVHPLLLKEKLRLMASLTRRALR